MGQSRLESQPCSFQVHGLGQLSSPLSTSVYLSTEGGWHYQPLNRVPAGNRWHLHTEWLGEGLIAMLLTKVWAGCREAQRDCAAAQD